MKPLPRSVMDSLRRWAWEKPLDHGDRENLRMLAVALREFLPKRPSSERFPAPAAAELAEPERRN